MNGINVELNMKDNISGQIDNIGKKINAIKFMDMVNFGEKIIGYAGRVFNYTKELNQFQSKVKATFQTTGFELHNQVGVIKSLADTYGTDFNNVLASSNILAKEFGISNSKALKLVKTGFEKGADANGEFLDMLKEYPAQLKSVGLNAEETIAIITQQVNAGVFSDKGVDAIKEAGLRLREMNPTTLEAVNLLGKETAEQVRLNIAKGDTFKAIQLISKGLKDTKLTASETQKVVSGIFGGAGEDAGLRYLKMLGDMNISLEDLKDTSSEFVKSQTELNAAWTTFVSSIVNDDGKISKVFTNIMGFFTDILDVLKTINQGFNFSSSVFINKFAGAEMSKYEKYLKLQIKHGTASGESMSDIEKRLSGGVKIDTSKREEQLSKMQKDFDNMFMIDPRRIKLNKDITQLQKEIDLDKYLNIQRESMFKDMFKPVEAPEDPDAPKNKDITGGSGDKTTLPKADTFGSQNKVSEIQINIEKQIESVYITSGENLMNLKDQLQRLLTEIIVDANAFAK